MLIAQLRKELASKLGSWRERQIAYMPSLQNVMIGQSPVEVEDEFLYLPSHFTCEQRDELGLVNLAIEELELREGQACDTILQLRRSVKALSAVRGRSKKNDEGQQQHTRSRGKIVTMEFMRDYLLSTYNLCRDAILNLGGPASKDLEAHIPKLGIDDLSRKPTIEKRQKGDSRRAEGNIWVTFGARTHAAQEHASGLHALEVEEVEFEPRKCSLYRCALRYFF